VAVSPMRFPSGSANEHKQHYTIASEPRTE
jgi:hypothetical protein